MADLVIAPDVEGLVITYLSDALAARNDTAWVSSKIPSRYRNSAGTWIDARPPRLVRIRRRGGPRTQVVVEVPLILIECWDEAGETNAGQLAALVCGLIAAMPDGNPVTEAQILSGPSNDPDPDTATPRYTSVAQLWVNAS